MNESTARELIDAVEGLTTAIYSLREYLNGNSVSNDELKSEVRGLGTELGRLGSNISSLYRSVDQNTSSVDSLASDIRSASSRY